jgi:hypothetical protein
MATVCIERSRVGVNGNFWGTVVFFGGGSFSQSLSPLFTRPYRPDNSRENFAVFFFVVAEAAVSFYCSVSAKLLFLVGVPQKGHAGLGEYMRVSGKEIGRRRRDKLGARVKTFRSGAAQVGTFRFLRDGGRTESLVWLRIVP